MGYHNSHIIILKKLTVENINQSSKKARKICIASIIFCPHSIVEPNCMHKRSTGVKYFERRNEKLVASFLWDSIATLWNLFSAENHDDFNTGT